MAKAILTCGKICCGKTTYANQLRMKYNAVVLSVDEITLALFGQNVGEKHDEYVEKTEKYLFDKSVEIIETGISAILDWGFWTKAERIFAREFYQKHGIECEFHYIDISPETWSERLSKRNKAVLSHEVSAYYVDRSLADKFDAIFEIPDKCEMDVWIEQ